MHINIIITKNNIENNKEMSDNVSRTTNNLKTLNKTFYHI